MQLARGKDTMMISSLKLFTRKQVSSNAERMNRQRELEGEVGIPLGSKLACVIYLEKKYLRQYQAWLTTSIMSKAK